MFNPFLTSETVQNIETVFQSCDRYKLYFFSFITISILWMNEDVIGKCHFFQFFIQEALFVSILDEFPDFFRRETRRPLFFRIILTVILGLLSLIMVTDGGFYMFTLFNESLAAFPLLICAIGEIFGIIYVYGKLRIEI